MEGGKKKTNLRYSSISKTSTDFNGISIEALTTASFSSRSGDNNCSLRLCKTSCLFFLSTPFPVRSLCQLPQRAQWGKPDFHFRWIANAYLTIIKAVCVPEPSQERCSLNWVLCIAARPFGSACGNGAHRLVSRCSILQLKCELSLL